MVPERCERGSVTCVRLRSRVSRPRAAIFFLPPSARRSASSPANSPPTALTGAVQLKMLIAARLCAFAVREVVEVVRRGHLHARAELHVDQQPGRL